MSEKIGRPPKGAQPRTEKITIRISESESKMIQHCADKMNTTRTDAIIAGVVLLQKELDK